jgi:ATP-dependent RNA helicase DHX29
LIADTASIDRKIRFCVAPKTNVALKILREQLSNVLAQQYQGKALTQSQEAWKDLGLLALSKTKIKQDKDNSNDVVAHANM